MKFRHFFFPFLSYPIGTALGLFLILTVTWADMEAASYGFSRLASPGLGGFKCPAWMTREERDKIALDVSNPTEGPLRPAIRTQISTPGLQEQFMENVQLSPGESKRLEWEVGPENIDLKSFIFAKTMVSGVYPVPSREATCGIYIVDPPGRGEVIVPVLIGFSLLSMGAGLYGMKKWGHANAWVSKNDRILAFLAFLVALGLVLSLRIGWLPGLLILVLALFVITILLGSLSMSVPGER
jgi:hypothetical protein